MERIRLREPQITPVEGGFLLSDPYGVFPKPVAVTEGGLFLVSLMEGKTLEEVQVVSLTPLLTGRKGQVLAYRLDLEAPTLSAVGAGTLVFPTG